MLAKRRNDLCLRGIMVYKELIEDFYPDVKFGYINIHEDEGLKVAFGELAVPFTFAIFGGRAYRFPFIEGVPKLTEWLKDLEIWKTVPIQFDVP